MVLVRGDEVGFVFLDCGGLKLFDLVDDVVDAKVGVLNAQCSILISR